MFSLEIDTSLVIGTLGSSTKGWLRFRSGLLQPFLAMSIKQASLGVNISMNPIIDITIVLYVMDSYNLTRCGLSKHLRDNNKPAEGGRSKQPQTQNISKILTNITPK